MLIVDIHVFWFLLVLRMVTKVVVFERMIQINSAEIPYSPLRSAAIEEMFIGEWACPRFRCRSWGKGIKCCS